MTDKTPDTVNELMGTIIGAEKDEVAMVGPEDFADVGIWQVYYRKPGQKWSLPLTQFDHCSIKVTADDIHMDDFVGDMGQNGNEHFPGWDCAIAWNKESGSCFSFGDPHSLMAANKFIQNKIFKKGFGND